VAVACDATSCDRCVRRLLNTGLRFSSLFRDPSRGPAARAADHHYPMAPKVDSLRRRHFTEKMTSGSEDIWAALKRKEDETHKCVAMAKGQLKTATSDEERAQIRGKLQEDLRKRTLPLGLIRLVSRGAHPCCLRCCFCVPLVSFLVGVQWRVRRVPLQSKVLIVCAIFE